MRRAWIVLLGGALIGCGGGEVETAKNTSATGGGATTLTKRPKFLFITNSIADWWNAVEKGMDDAGKEFGCDVELRHADGQVQGQVDLLREAMSLSGLDGVAVSVLEADAPGIADAMRELKEAGKVVITYDSDIAADHADLRSAYIGTNNFKGGEAGGKAAAILKPKGGKVVAFVSTFQAANARERRDGFLAGAGPKFTLGEGQSWEDGAEKTRARSNVQSALTRTPDAGLFLGLYSYNAVPIAEIVHESPAVRAKATVATFDLDEAAVSQLEQGNIDVAICQNPYDMGYYGTRLLKALWQKDEKTVKEILPDGKARDTGVRLIVPKADSPVKAALPDVITIEEMKAWLKSKGLKSS